MSLADHKNMYLFQPPLKKKKKKKSLTTSSQQRCFTAHTVCAYQAVGCYLAVGSTTSSQRRKKKTGVPDIFCHLIIQKLLSLCPITVQQSSAARDKFNSVFFTFTYLLYLFLNALSLTGENEGFLIYFCSSLTKTHVHKSR